MFKIYAEQPWIMMIGSPRASEAMLIYTARAVEQAVQKKYVILTTDCPSGVDRKVVTASEWFGAQVVLMHPLDASVPASGVSLSQMQTMIALCNLGMCIWDGRDEATKAAYKLLVELGKEAHLVSFRKVRQPGDKPEQANFMPPPPPALAPPVPTATVQGILF